jgi:hypothetical protein
MGLKVAEKYGIISLDIFPEMSSSGCTVMEVLLFGRVMNVNRARCFGMFQSEIILVELQ